MDTMVRVGGLCREYRREVLGMTQREIAVRCGYSKESVSAFECGRCNNGRILLEYIYLGLFNWCGIDELRGDDAVA